MTLVILFSSKGVNRIYPPTSRLTSALMMVMPLPIGHPNSIPAVCAARISILRRPIFAVWPMCHKRGFRVSGGKCGPFWCMSPIRLAPFYQGGGKCWQTIAVRPFLPFRALFGKEKPGQCERAVCDGNWDERNVIERKSL